MRALQAFLKYSENIYKKLDTISSFSFRDKVLNICVILNAIFTSIEMQNRVEQSNIV